MKTVFDIYRTIKETKADTYFAGSYTSSGYVGEYKAFADERQLERLYVIKGGSSRGKQTVIDRCIRAAQDAGVSVEYYLESPDSIGCVVLGKRLSVISDTSYSGRILYPGVFSEVIDLTVFSRCDILEKKRKDIVELTSRKTESLASAYRYLRAVKVLEEEKAVCTSAVFMQEKASACIDRLIKKLGRPQQKNGAVSYVRTHTLNGKGAFAVDTFEKIAEKRYYVNDCYGCAAVFMRMLADKLSAEGFRIKVSRLPVPDIIEGIFIEDCAVSVTVEKTRQRHSS